MTFCVGILPYYATWSPDCITICIALHVSSSNCRGIVACCRRNWRSSTRLRTSRWPSWRTSWHKSNTTKMSSPSTFENSSRATTTWSEPRGRFSRWRCANIVWFKVVVCWTVTLCLILSAQFWSNMRLHFNHRIMSSVYHTPKNTWEGRCLGCYTCLCWVDYVIDWD